MVADHTPACMHDMQLQHGRGGGHTLQGAAGEHDPGGCQGIWAVVLQSCVVTRAVRSSWLAGDRGVGCLRPAYAQPSPGSSA